MNNELIILLKLVDNATGVSQKAHQNVRQHIKGTADVQAKADADYVKAMKSKANAMAALAKTAQKGSQDAAKAQTKADADYVKSIKLKERAVADFAKTIERRGRDAANAQAKATKDAARVDRERAKEMATNAKEIEKINSERLARQRKAESDHAKFMADIGRAQVKRAADTARAEQRSAIDSAKVKQKAATDALRAEKMAMEDKHRAAMTQWSEEQSANQEREESSKRQANATMGNIKAVGLYIAASFGLNSVGSILDKIYEKWEKIRRSTNEAAADIVDDAGKVRRLAAMEDNETTPSKSLAGVYSLMNKTSLNFDEALNYKTKAMSSMYGAIKAGVTTTGEADKALPQVAQLGQLAGAVCGAMGTLIGILPSVTGKRKGNTAADMTSLAQRLYKEQKLGGFEDMGQAANQFAKVSEYVTKGVYTAPEAQALLSAFALNSQGENAGERFEQITQAVNVGAMRDRGMKITPEMKKDYETSAKYFKKIGVTEKTSSFDRVMAITKDLHKYEQETTAKGEKPNVTQYLIQHGFTNQEWGQAASKAGAAEFSGIMGELTELAHAPLTPSTTPEDWETAKKDPFFKREAAKTQAELKSKATGSEGGEGVAGLGVFRENAMRQAYANLGGKTAFGEEFEAVRDRQWYEPYELINQSKVKLEREAQRMLVEEAEKRGANVEGAFQYYPGTQTGDRSKPVWKGWKSLYELGESNVRKGGDLIPGEEGGSTDQRLADINDGINRLIDAVKDQKHHPMPGKPDKPLTAKPVDPVH